MRGEAGVPPLFQTKAAAAAAEVTQIAAKRVRERGEEAFFHRRLSASEQILHQSIMSEMDVAGEEYPTEIHDYLSAFETSVVSVDEMLKTMMSVSKSELLQKLDPLEQAKLDLVSAYTLNSMFWVYLATQGMNPKEHPVKQELERIRTYMNRVKEIEDKKKAAKLDKGAASRFVRNALYEPKPQNRNTKKTPVPAKKKKAH